jgi:hypothetical protein
MAAQGEKGKRNWEAEKSDVKQILDGDGGRGDYC